MNLFRTACGYLVLLALSCQAAGGRQPSAAADRRADWLAEAGWGLFTHYLAGTVASGDKTTVDEWNEAVDSFDVDAYAERLARFGASYTCITLGQNSGHFIAPNATYGREINYNGGAVTWDVPVEADGSIPKPFVDQLEALGRGLAEPRPMTPPGNLASYKPAKLLDLPGEKILSVNGAKHFARHGVDGDPKTRAQAGGEWPWTYHVDLIDEAPVGKIVVTFAKDAYPTEYKILVSAGDSGDWKTVAHQTAAKPGKHTHEFAPAPTRYVRVQGIKPDRPNEPGGQMAVTGLEVYAARRSK